MVNMQCDRVDAMFMGVSAVILFVSPINSRFRAGGTRSFINSRFRAGRGNKKFYKQ